MGIAKRGRRKITVNGRSYVWFIDERDIGHYPRPDGPGLLLCLIAHIISEDKRFNIHYAFEQKNLPAPYVPHMFVLGHEFPGLSRETNLYIATPRWDDTAIGQKFIRTLIEWAMNDQKEIVKVTALGKPLDS